MHPVLQGRKVTQNLCLQKIDKYITLQNAKYSPLLEKVILEEIKKIEKHQDKVNYIADSLRMGGTATANQYLDEAATVSTATDVLVDRAMKQIHNQAAEADKQVNKSTTWEKSKKKTKDSNIFRKLPI